MGQKVNPIGFRIGIIRDWDAKWFADKKYADLLHEDLKVRKFILKKLSGAAVSRVELERAAKRLRITIHTARPGMVIGRGGAEVDSLRRALEKLTDRQVHINILEVKNSDLDALLVAENIAAQLVKRTAFRRAMKQSLFRSMRAGAKGIKISCSGRLGGAEMARNEMYHEGSVPLQTLRADIDYGFAEAQTTYGLIGVKVWIYKGEILPDKQPIKPATKGGETNADS